MMSGGQASTRGRGPHRERGQATPSLVAVASVVAVVAAMVAFFAGGAGDDASSDPEEQSQSRPTRSATPTANARPPTAARTATPERRETKKRTKSKQKKDTRAQNRRPQSPEPEPGPPEVYVEVYNNTTISGLAASTAAELQDAGWRVVGVDNWYGDIPASTVYYPAGLETEADELAEALGIDRVRGAVAPMKFDRLTVILTPDAA